MKNKWPLLVVLVVLIGGIALAGTMVPGHQKKVDKGITDTDENGYPDEGVSVTGKYTSVYSYDEPGDYYWDLGDGRIQSSAGITSAADLDQATLTTCDYQVQYKGNFENDPYLNSGWIINNINCKGFDDNAKYNYLIVHQSDPRYEGNPANSIWGTWEYQALTVSGYGNLARPEKPVEE